MEYKSFWVRAELGDGRWMERVIGRVRRGVKLVVEIGRREEKGRG